MWRSEDNLSELIFSLHQELNSDHPFGGKHPYLLSHFIPCQSSLVPSVF